MDNRDREVLLKIRKHILHILNYSEPYTDRMEFEADEMCVEACVFNLMQIGELAKNPLSEELKSELKAIPWNQIYGLRNRIVHGYEGVDLSIVWTTIQEDLPALKSDIDNL